MLMYLALAEEGAGRGITLIDLCSGQDVYKFHLANDSYPVAAGAVWVSRTEDAARKVYRRLMHRTSPNDRMPAWARSRLDPQHLGGPGEVVEPVPLTEPE
jgi:hypothetical protein